MSVAGENINFVVGARFNASLTANALVQVGAEPLIYTSSRPSSWSDAARLVRFVPMPFRLASEFSPLQMTRRLKYLDTLIFSRLASFRMKPAEILHGWASFALESAELQKRRGGLVFIDRACPHAAFQFELISEESESLGQPKDALMSMDMVDRMEREYDLADVIIVPSSYSYRSFVEKGVNESKLQLVRLDSTFKQPPRREWKSESTEFVVGCIGGNPLRKGFSYLIDAWHRCNLPNARLLLKTSRDQLSKYSALYNAINGDDSIQIVDYVHDIQDFYNRCDLFCLPSIDDGFGLVVMEALASGIPVVVTSNVGAADFVENGKNGFVVEPRDIDTLAEKFSFLYENYEKRIFMADNAYVMYKEHSESGENYSTKIAQLYNRFL